MNKDVDALARIFWEWHDQSHAPLEVRSYLRELAEYVAIHGDDVRDGDKPSTNPAWIGEFDGYLEEYEKTFVAIAPETGLPTYTQHPDILKEWIALKLTKARLSAIGRYEKREKP